MKKFRFRLEPLLKQREQIEQDRQRELAEAVRRTQVQRERLEEISGSRQTTLERKRERQTGEISVGELQLYSRYLHRLKRDTLGAEELLRALRKTEQKRREALLEAAKHKKIYETLKERQRERFQRDFAAKATKEADEIGLNSFRAGRKKPA